MGKANTWEMERMGWEWNDCFPFHLSLACSDGVCAEEHQTGAFQNQHLERAGQDITLFI